MTETDQQFVERMMRTPTIANKEEFDRLLALNRWVEQAVRIEKLEAALREIAKHSRGGVIDTTEKMDRDEFIGIARAALEGT